MKASIERKDELDHRQREYVDAVFDLTEDEWPEAPKHTSQPSHCVIVGKGPLAVYAPFFDPEARKDAEFWGLNDSEWRRGFAPVRSYNRWFQLHNPEYMSIHYPPGVEELGSTWSKDHGDMILYMDRHYPEYPNSVPLPVEDMEEAWPNYMTHYHASSFDWMVATAIYQGFSKISMFGCDFHTFPSMLDGEPLSGRACLEYWIGVAQGRGIEVGVYTNGDLFLNVHLALHRSTMRYGIEGEPALDLSLNRTEKGYWADVR